MADDEERKDKDKMKPGSSTAYGAGNADVEAARDVSQAPPQDAGGPHYWPTPIDTVKGIGDIFSGAGGLLDKITPSFGRGPVPQESYGEMKKADDVRDETRVADKAVDQAPKPVTPRVKKIVADNKTSTGEDVTYQPPVDDDGGQLRNLPPPKEPGRDTELAQALHESQLRHKIGMVFQMFGIQPSNMDEPLQDLAQKRQLQREHEQDVMTQEANDPNSRPSRMVQAMAIKKFGWSPQDAMQLSANDWQKVQQGYTASEMHADRLAKLRMSKYEADVKAKTAAGEQATQRRGQDIGLLEERERTAAAEGKPDKVSPRFEQQIQGYTALDAALNQMPEGNNPKEMERWLGDASTSVAASTPGSRMGKQIIDEAKAQMPNFWTAATDNLGLGRANKMREEARRRLDQKFEEAVSSEEALHGKPMPELRRNWEDKRAARAGGSGGRSAAPNSRALSPDQARALGLPQ